MTIKEDIKHILLTVLEELDLLERLSKTANFVPEVEFAANEKFGDLSTNVAMVAYSQLKLESATFTQAYKSPRDLAEAIIAKIQTTNDWIPATDGNDSVLQALKKCEVAGPGFVNFTVSEQYLLSELDRVNGEKKDYGKKLSSRLSSGGSGQKKRRKMKAVVDDISANQLSSQSSNTKRILVEFTDPNPFKVFHMGHLFSNVVGESLARLFESQGQTVRRVCYQGDVGMHVANSLYGLLHLAFDGQIPSLAEAQAWIKDQRKEPLNQRVALLGQCYAFGATAYKEDESSHQFIKQLNFLAYASAQKRLVDEESWQPQIDYTQLTEIKPDELAVIDLLYRAGRSWSLEAFENLYRRLGTKFKDYFFESQVGEYGVKIIKAYLGDVFEESQGAIVFKGEEYGLHTRVFLNKLGLPVYEAKDMALVSVKADRWAYDQSFIVTGNEINEYFKVVLKAMSLIEPEYAEKTTHIGHGMLRLPEGKMSSRTGKVLTGETILDEAQSRVLDIFAETNPEIPEDQRDRVADKIGLAAIKFALLRSDVSSDVAFSFKDSISFTGNSGPYLQYTYARCLSVLGKAKLGLRPQATGDSETNPQGLGSNPLSSSQDILKEIDWSKLEIELNAEERAVLNWLWRFGETVENAATEYAPHLVATYVYELAQRFNSFYNKHSILGLGPQGTGYSETNHQDLSPKTSQTLLRLALTAATAQVLANGLGLLGIEVVEKM